MERILQGESAFLAQKTGFLALFTSIHMLLGLPLWRFISFYFRPYPAIFTTLAHS
jgi:hypothetical protein